MHSVAVWVVFILVQSSRIFVVGLWYIDPMASQTAATTGITDKRVSDLTEPTCEELRAMWRYTKRQSRAAKTTNGYPMYPDPFAYNLWQSYSDRAKSNFGYRSPTPTARYAGRARSRAAGGAPIYGRMVHKAPAGSRLRNGMRHRTRIFEDMSRSYGTVNRYPPSSRRITNTRIGGGGSAPMPQVPQAGSFQHLKDLITAERARELQKQYIVEEMAAKSAALKDTREEEQDEENERQRGGGNTAMHPPKHFLNPLQPLQIPTKVNYDFGQGRYMSNVPNVGRAWSRSAPHSREYMLR